MILPPGQCIKSAIDLATLDFFVLLQELTKKSFTGYLTMMIRGVGGLEEGTLVYDGGKIVACTYEYLKYDNLLLGSDAFLRIVNASTAKKGIVDLYQLSSDQIKLVIAFNEKMVFVPNEKDLRNIKVTEFSPFLEDQIKEKVKTDRTELLKKLKMGEVANSGDGGKPEANTDQPAETDSDMLEELVKG